MASLAASSSSPASAAWLHRPFSRREKAVLLGEILVVYAKSWWWLRRHGLRPAVDRLRAGSSPAEPADPTSSYHSVVRLGLVVQRALRPLPADTRCLARSLVLTGLLARRGIGCTLIIGVSPAPDFKAHAWVEHLELPVLPAGGGEYERLLEL